MSQSGWYPYKKRKRGYRHTEGRPCEDRKKTAIHKTRREPSKEINAASTLIPDFYPPRAVRK